LDFPLNKTHILPDFRGNQKELDKIRGILDSITSNPDYEITGIYLTGYASPEGSYAQNEVLSRDPHKSAERLLAPQVFIPGKPLSRGLARRRLDRVKEIDSPVRDAK